MPILLFRMQLPQVTEFYMSRKTRISGTITALVLSVLAAGLLIFAALSWGHSAVNTVMALVFFTMLLVALLLSVPSLFRWRILIDGRGITQEYGRRSRRLLHEDVEGFQQLPMGIAIRSKSGAKPIKFSDVTDGNMMLDWLRANFPALEA